MTLDPKLTVVKAVSANAYSLIEVTFTPIVILAKLEASANE